MENAAVFENKDRILLPYDKVGVNSTFRTSINGFNKESVLFYIDNLRKDAATQQRTFTVEIDRLYTKNVELSRSVANCEKEIGSLTKRLEQEQEKHRLLEDENSLLGNVVEKLQGRMGELQGEIDHQRSIANRLSQQLYASEQRANMLQQAAMKASEQLRYSTASCQNVASKSNQLAQQVNYLNSRSQQLEQSFASRAAQYEQTIEYFKSNYERLNNENRQLKATGANYSNLSRQNASLTSMVDSLQKRVQQLNAEARRQSDYVRSLINQLNNTKNQTGYAPAPYLSSNAAPAPSPQYVPVYSANAPHSMQMPQTLYNAHSTISAAAGNQPAATPQSRSTRPDGSYVQSFGINIG